MNTQTPNPPPPNIAIYGILTLNEICEKLFALAIGGSFIYHTGFIAMERARDNKTKKALDRLTLFVQLLTAAGLVFPYQDRVSEGKYQYGIKLMKNLPLVIHNIAKDIAARDRFKDNWFVETKLAQIKTNLK